MARAALGWTTAELAAAAQVAANTVSRFETGRRGGHSATVGAIEEALKGAGVRFLDDGESIGVTLSKVR